MENARNAVSLPFSDKYSRDHSLAYFRKHRATLSRRLSNWRDMQIARKALKLAGEPALVLDLPCGAGRFWPVLAEHPDRIIIGADNSADMLEVARNVQPPELVQRVQTMQTSAFAIDLPDASVDSVFCMRLLHHVGESGHRLAMLREMARVSRDSVIASLWVDGNYKARRRQRLEARRAHRNDPGFQNRFVIPAATIEAEFAACGLEILGRLDFLPRYAMWRTYVLRKKTS
ncbi:MAG: class I SAM-dependent methyltransferase [Zoogloeaceae bacterium]|nr:class I SAM-dependent methyltransferase [Zoogloeaceae bacterium]